LLEIEKFVFIHDLFRVIEHREKSFLRNFEKKLQTTALSSWSFDFQRTVKYCQRGRIENT